MSDSPTPLFVPPCFTRHPALPAVLPLIQPVPATSEPALHMTIAKIDHSGRVPATELLTVLGWNTGDHTYTSVTADAIIIRKARDERPSSPIDPRRQVCIPAGAQAHFNLHAGDRLLLVALPLPVAALLAHPIATVTSILTAHYALSGDWA
jgi:bifunctional DNA-binding transcriptional regulator/antitoxin component of YhaV-PrlF toxin-antitoxin module